MKWILILIWAHDGSMMGAQFGPFADRAACEAVKKELMRGMEWAGPLRVTCALSSIDPLKLPQVEVSGGPKARR